MSITIVECRNRLNIIKLLHAEGHPWSGNTCNVLACHAWKTYTLEWCIRHGAAFNATTAVDSLYCRNRLQHLKLLFDVGCPMDSPSLYDALLLYCGDVAEAIRWIHANVSGGFGRVDLLEEFVRTRDLVDIVGIATALHSIGYPIRRVRLTARCMSMPQHYASDRFSIGWRLLQWIRGLYVVGKSE